MRSVACVANMHRALSPRRLLRLQRTQDLQIRHRTRDTVFGTLADGTSLTSLMFSGTFLGGLHDWSLERAVAEAEAPDQEVRAARDVRDKSRHGWGSRVRTKRFGRAGDQFQHHCVRMQTVEDEVADQRADESRGVVRVRRWTRRGGRGNVACP